MRCWVGGLLLLLCSPVFAFKMEAGSFTIASTFGNANFTVVPLQQTYDNPPLIFVLPTEEGGDPSDVRIRNVTGALFEAVQAEPPGNDGPHIAMTVHYIAIEPGDHVLPDGTRIQAGSINTQTLQAHNSVGGPTGWDSVSFPTAFGGTATVLAQIQTMNNEELGDIFNPPAPAGPSRPWLVTGMRNVSATGFEAALDRAEVSQGSITQDEVYGWMAIEAGTTGQLEDTGGNTIDFDAYNSGDVIDGWDDGCDTSNFPTINSGTRIAVASQITRDGNNGGWVRRCSLGNNNIGLTIDEDVFNDTERTHTTENVGVIVFDNAFIYDDEGEADILLMKLFDVVISDPFNNNVNPKAIPGAVVQYRINASNQGNGAGSNVVVSDPIPNNTAMFVGDVAGLNSGPIIFSNGTPSSGLTYNYNAVAPTTDDLEFSNDNGANWNYQPTADAEGFDAAVTNFRINFGSTFDFQTGGTAPNFDVRFRVRVD